MRWPTDVQDGDMRWKPRHWWVQVRVTERRLPRLFDDSPLVQPWEAWRAVAAAVTRLVVWDFWTGEPVRWRR